MERFSWSDNLRAALSPCLTCLHSRRDEEDDDERQQYNHHRATNTHGPDYVPRARLDELEGLLADSDDAETLSLHSNLGRDDTRRRKHHRPRKGIRLFGFDLFGKPPIQLPEDDDVADGRVQRSRTISASTMDSDASPLDPSMIDQLSAARVAEGEAQRDAERRAKDERRRRRRDKKAAREAALALALDRNQDGDEFEGFPGSGRSFSSPGAPSSSGYDESDDFGPFAQAQSTSQDQADVDGADFGAEAYAKRPRMGGSSGTGSDSRSRSSASHSRGDSVQYNHLAFPQGQSQSGPSPTLPAAHRRKKSSRQSISSASQSNSITSPPAHFTTFPAVAPHDRSPLAEPSGGMDQPVITIDTPNGFPSVGFSGGMRRKNSEVGVFLANRGE